MSTTSFKKVDHASFLSYLEDKDYEKIERPFGAQVDYIVDEELVAVRTMDWTNIETWKVREDVL